MNIRDEITTAYVQGASGRMNPSDAEICAEANAYAAHFPKWVFMRGEIHLALALAFAFGIFVAGLFVRFMS